MRTILIPAGAGLVALTLAATLASAPALATKPGSGSTTGSAKIFKVNPVQSTGDQT
ncbi:MAG: bacillolysin, partial [Nocardioides sp.]|nr:bacillolysin [Nocardioides sp.]